MKMSVYHFNRGMKLLEIIRVEIVDKSIIVNMSNSTVKNEATKFVY